MKCTAVQNLLNRKIDEELSGREAAELEAHLSQCASCSREYGLMSLPTRLGRAISPPAASPYFYGRLRSQLEAEVQNAAGWQVILGLARQVIPVLAGITLALITVFAYHQLSSPKPDLYRAYDRIFATEEQPHRMLISEEGYLTDESVLIAIAERDSNHR
jgi:anti-sigma factor RsiW